MKQSEAMPVTPSLVTWARERAGYSLSEAEGHFKKIRQWEAGEMFPTYPQVESLSDRFKIPVAAFFLPEPPKVPKIDETFRTLSHETMEGIPPNIRLLLRKARAMQISLYELNEGKNPATRLVTRDLEFDPYTGSIDTMVGQLRDYLDAQVEDQLSWDSVEHALENWRNILFDHGVYDPITGRQTQHPLCDQGLEGMLDPIWIAMVGKTGRQSAGHVKQPVSFTQQQHTAVRCQSTAVKRAYDRASSETFE